MAKKNQKPEEENPLNQEVIGVRELQFLMGCHISAAAWMIENACFKANIEHKRGIKLPVGVLSWTSGFDIAEKIEQQSIIYLKHRDSKQALLNDPKCVAKGDFAGRWRPLKRFLPQEAIEYIVNNWKTKQELLARQTSIAA